MFSGIVETIGTILSITNNDGCKHFCIAPNIVFDDLKIGDSVSVNGVCLTIVAFTADYFCVIAVPETLRLTNLNFLKENNKVNLERAITLSTRIGGHQMQGHIDSVAKIICINHETNENFSMTMEISASLSIYIIKKGFIGLDGMSITVTDIKENMLTVIFIPHTRDVTIVKYYQINDLVNVEVDQMAKYIEKILGVRAHVATN